MMAVRRALRLAIDPGLGTGLVDLHDAAARIGIRLRDLGAFTGSIVRPLPPPTLLGRTVTMARPGYRVWLAVLAGLGIVVTVAAASALTMSLTAWLAGPASADAGLVTTDLFTEEPATRRFLAFLATIARGEGAIADMFTIANLAILLLSGLIVLALFTQAVVDTARGGRPGTSGIQVLRVVMVLGLLTPLGGFNAVQHLALGAAGFGGHAASRIWAAFSTQVIADGVAPLPIVVGHGHDRLIGQFLVAETCRAVANGLAAGTGDPPYITVVERTGQSGVARQAVIGYDAVKRPGACGVARFPSPGGDGAAARTAAAHREALSAVLPEIRTLAVSLAGHFVDGAANYGQPLPDSATAIGGSGLAQRYATLAGTRIAAVQQAAARDIPGAVTAQARSGGWLAAPLTFQVIARRNGGIQAAARDLPAVDPPDPGYALHVAEAFTAAVTVRNWLDAAGAPAGGAGAVATAGDSVFETLLGLLDVRITLVDETAPLSSLAAVGNTLIEAGLKGFAIMTGIVAGSNTFRSIPFVGDGLDAAGAVWRVVDTPVTTVLMALFAAGGILAYLVPLIPFIRFAFALAVWLLALLEALLAAPIWLLAFLSFDKDRLWPAAARDGAGLLLAVVLRPLLMIFGLVLGYLAASALCGFLNAGFEPLIANSDGVGPIDWLVHVVIYTLLAWLLVNFAFGAVDRMPSAVLAWIGIRIDTTPDGERAGSSIVTGLGRAEHMRPGLPGRRGRT